MSALVVASAALLVFVAGAVLGALLRGSPRSSTRDRVIVRGGPENGKVEVGRTYVKYVAADYRNPARYQFTSGHPDFVHTYELELPQADILRGVLNTHREN